MSTVRAVKIGLAWTTTVWTVCYLVVGLIPGLASASLPYLLHLNVGPVENVFTISNFLVGLILWNIIVAAGIALAGSSENSIATQAAFEGANGKCPITPNG